MRKAVSALLVVVALAAAAWWFFGGRKSDEEKIAAVFDRLVDACGKAAKESPIVMATKNAEFSNIVADPCSVDVREAMIDGTFRPLEFASRITKGRAMFKTLNGKVEDLVVKVDPGGKKAVAEYSIRVWGESGQRGAFDESRDLRSELIKVDGKWKISSFVVDKVLER